MPRRLARGAKISRVSRAMARRRSSGRASRVRMLCSRSASLMSTTRTSSTMASSILRRFSASARARAAAVPLPRVWMTSILVTPSTRRATVSPKRARISSRPTPQSSTTSCRIAAATVSASMLRPSRMRATARACSTKGSPEARVWPAWACRANSPAARIRAASSGARRPATSASHSDMRSVASCSWAFKTAVSVIYMVRFSRRRSAPNGRVLSTSARSSQPRRAWPMP